MRTCYNSKTWALIIGLLFMGPFSVPVYAEEQLVEFATLSKLMSGSIGGSFSRDEARQNGGRHTYVITNRADLEELWHTANFDSPMYSQILSLPEVDFTQKMVIAVFRWVNFGCSDISITKLVEAEETLTVHLREKDCNAGFEAWGLPFHIIESARTDKEILFTVSEKLTL